jgi:hypothetical protein
MRAYLNHVGNKLRNISFCANGRHIPIQRRILAGHTDTRKSDYRFMR